MPSGAAAVSGSDRLVVGISGASGVVYGIRLLETLRALPVESHLVISKSAELTLAYETDLKVARAWSGVVDCGRRTQETSPVGASKAARNGGGTVRKRKV